MNMKTRALVTILVFFWSLSAHAKLISYDGTEPGFWDDTAVIYGEITNVVLDSHRKIRSNVTLDVQATLTGSLDAAHSATISCPIDFMPAISAVHEAPRANTKVVVLVQKGENGDYIVDSSAVLFMPNSSPLVVVKNFEDAKVKLIISRLREVRKKAEDKHGTKKH